jgi:hypothetical protein
LLRARVTQEPPDYSRSNVDPVARQATHLNVSAILESRGPTLVPDEGQGGSSLNVPQGDDLLIVLSGLSATGRHQGGRKPHGSAAQGSGPLGFDVAGRLGERFTYASGDDFGPNWSRPGGDRIFFVYVTPFPGRDVEHRVSTAGGPLFPIHPRPARLDAYPYDVTSDGQRILVNTLVEEMTPPITLVVNWGGAK